jgi:hypothetical protein
MIYTLLVQAHRYLSLPKISISQSWTQKPYKSPVVAHNFFLEDYRCALCNQLKIETKDHLFFQYPFAWR